MPRPPDPWRPWIGRPYRQPFGCFELVRAVLLERGIEIPDYAEQVTEAQKAAALRVLIARHADQVERPIEGDVVLLEWGGQPAHIGVMVNGREFIHALEHCGAHIERTDSLRWRHRVLGFWRPRPAARASVSG